MCRPGGGRLWEKARVHWNIRGKRIQDTAHHEVYSKIYQTDDTYNLISLSGLAAKNVIGKRAREL